MSKKESMDEALKPHEKIISKTFKTTNKIEIKGIDRLIDMSSIGVVQAMQKQNPRGFTKTVMNLGKLKEDFESLDEVKRQEVEDIIVPKGMSVSSVWAITEDGNQIELDCGHICYEDENANEIGED